MEDNMFGEGTMPVEMAIRREMEYRRKLAQMQKVSEAEFCRNLRPFVVQSSIPGPSLGSQQMPGSTNAAPPLTMLQGSSHEPSSSSGRGQRQPPISASSLRPCSKQTPDATPEVPLMKLQGPTSQPTGHGNLQQSHNDYTFCNICQVPCSGYTNFMQHMEGRKHKNRQLEVELGRKDCSVGESPRRWCETCKIWCMNEDLFQSHLGGRPHKNQAQKFVAGEDSGKQIVAAKQVFNCDLCRIECSSEELLILHFKGKKHSAAELAKVSDGGGNTGNQQGRHWCDLCNIWCIDKQSLEMHRRGKRHIVQLHESKRKKARF
ncbi:Zinc finger protein 346 [Linum perenne]